MRLLALALALVTSLALATTAHASCLDMEGPPPGTTAGVGPLLTLPDGQVSLRPFLSAIGFIAGMGTIVVSNHANGTPVQEMNLNNINLVVQPNPPVTVADFVYADFGGDVNLGINGALVRRPDLSAMPAAIAGVNVAVTRINLFGFHFGTVTLTGTATNPIKSFGVGGQEFFVDDVCW